MFQDGTLPTVTGWTVVVMETENTTQRRARVEALRTLGMAMESEGFNVRLVSPVGADPFLRVANRQAGGLLENVSCGPGVDGRMVFTYSWGDPIAPVDEASAAVARLAHVLAPLAAPEAVAARAAPGRPVTTCADPAESRKAALESLAGLLVEQRYVVRVGEFHLVASDRVGEGALLVEVWCQSRPDRGGRLCFTWAGGGLVCEADRPTDALVAVKTALMPRRR
jgi:hypothetical protein